MKKRLSLLLVLALTLSLVFALSSCGGSNTNTDTNTETEAITDTETNTDESEHVHVEETIPAVAPTCTETGLTEGKKCSVCGEILVEQETLNKTIHTYVDSYTCTVCGETAKESQGLLYDYTDETKTAYTVVGIGTCTDNDIVIPYAYNGLPVVGISSGAFYECINITSVTLSNNILWLDDGAFQNCYGMVRFVVGTGVEYLWIPAFVGCTKLIEIYDLSEDPLTLENAQMGLYGFGGIFTKNGGPYDLMAVNSSTKTPSLIFEQDDFMFITKDNKNYLLGYKGNATDVTLPEAYNDEPYYIFKYSFSNCTSIKNISIPNSVLGASSNAFSIPSIRASDSDVLALSFKFNEYENGLYLGNEDNPYLVLVETIDGSGTINESTKIIAGNCAFYWANQNSDIVIPDSVVSIGEKGIAATQRNIIIGKNLKEFEVNAFAGHPVGFTVDTENSHFKSIDGNLYTKDGKTLIKYTGESESFEIPDSVTTIESYAFNDFTINNLTMPKTVTEIKENAFWESSILNLNYLGSVKEWVSPNLVIAINSPIRFENLYFNGVLAEDIIITSDIDEIRDYAFAYCDSIRTATIEPGLTKIGNYAFLSCINLTNIVISETVTEIGASAFSGCHIFSITIPENVKELNSSIIYGCYYLVEIYNLTDVEFQSTTTNYYPNKTVIHSSLDEPSIIETVGDFVFASLESGPYLIAYTGTSDSITLPVYNNEYTLELNELSSKVDIKDVTIPKGCTLSEASTFKNSNIKSVKIEADWQEIPGEFFERCYSLKNVELPQGLKTISNAFVYCYSLNSIVIPSSVETLDPRVFNDCNSLIEVYNLSSVSLVPGEGAARSVKVVHTSLDEESVIETQDDYAFYDGYLIGYNGNDTKLVLPKDFKGENYSIAAYALYNTSFEQIIISSVKSIDIAAFEGCKLFFENEIPTIDNEPSFITFEKLYADYIYYYSESKPTGEGNYWHYVDGKVVIWE